MVKLIFERVASAIDGQGWAEASPTIQRAKVPTGWLVRDVAATPVITFVSDPNHEWK